MRVNNAGPFAMSAAFGTMLDAGVVLPAELLNNPRAMDGVEIGGAVVHGCAALFAGVGTVVGATDPAPGFVLTTAQLAETAGYSLMASGVGAHILGPVLVAGGSLASIVGGAMNDKAQGY